MDNSTVSRDEQLVPILESGSFTRMQRRILRILADSQKHTKYELIKCIDDTEATLNNLQSHIYNIRKRLPQGHEIICEAGNGPITYRYVCISKTPPLPF